MTAPAPAPRLALVPVAEPVSVNCALWSLRGQDADGWPLIADGYVETLGDVEVELLLCEDHAAQLGITGSAPAATLAAIAEWKEMTQ